MIESIDLLEVIKPKVMAKQTDFTKMEKDCLKQVWEEIQATHGKKRYLDISCSSCVSDASTIVLNYINEKGLGKKEHSNVNRVVVEEVKEESIDLKSLKLPELRALFPNIQAKSKDDFLLKVEQMNK